MVLAMLAKLDLKRLCTSMLRRISSEPATLADLGKDRFLDKELNPVCLRGVEDPLRASRKGSMVSDHATHHNGVANSVLTLGLL